MDFTTHEALHVAHMLADVVQRHLAEHPAIVANEAWKAETDGIVDRLAELYQQIGAASI